MTDQIKIARDPPKNTAQLRTPKSPTFSARTSSTPSSAQLEARRFIEAAISNSPHGFVSLSEIRASWDEFQAGLRLVRGLVA